MIWTTLFTLSIAQCIFLIPLILIRGAKNSLASKLMSAMLVLMLFTNFGYLVIRTELLNYVPQFFVLPSGMMFLFGPLFYFYSRSVIDPSFRWKKIYWLHFIPYFIQLLINIPIFKADTQSWHWLISTFFAGNLSIRLIEKIILPVQNAQLFIYLLFTFHWITKAKNLPHNPQYIISVSARIKWLTKLTICFSVFFATVFSLYLFILIHGKYNSITNYIYTLVTSGIIYFIAYKLVLNPEIISPDFTRKYQAYMQFAGEEGDRYINKLKALMNENKLFTNPDLKLALLSREVGLPPHQLSKLINEKFAKSFNDYVNEHRVNEFILRVNDSKYQSFTIYGIALDVGFNSKSSFNTAFKKITGKTPSDYKIISTDRNVI
jgi:AraC-like DNA-binding protein